MPRVLIVDVSYLMFRSYFGYPSLTVKLETKNGVENLPIGAFFGFAKTILTIIKNYQIDELILATDLPFPTWRHDIHDNYKSGRKEMDENLRIQIPLINDWCAQITKNFLSLKGLEADDLIASCVINLNIDLDLKNNLKKLIKIKEENEQNISKTEIEEIDKMKNFLDFRDQYLWKNSLENELIKQSEKPELTNQNQIQNDEIETKNDKTLPNLNKNTTNSNKNFITNPMQINEDSQLFIYSKDRDLFQLLVFENVFFVENESNFQVFGQGEFEKKYELLPHQWLCYKTLVGDSSDKLDGIEGIGPKTATQILQEYKSVANFVNSKANSQIDKNSSKIENKINQKTNEKLSKWQDKIDLEKLTNIRRLSSLCWINLELESGFDLQNGLNTLVKYKFGSLIGMQNQITKNKNGEKLTENYEQNNKETGNTKYQEKILGNAKKMDKNSQHSKNSQIGMEDLF